MPYNNEQSWKKYCERELETVIPILKKLGFELDSHQKHLCGERYLMSGHKLVLTGRKKIDDTRAVIKVSSDKQGIKEIERERKSRQTLHALDFAYYTFLSPEELLHTRENGFTIVVTKYIEQEEPFLTRPIEEQFSLALKSFKTQEGVHATTYAHSKVIRSVFEIWNATDYINSFTSFKKNALVSGTENEKLEGLYEHALAFLSKHQTDIERYCGFLTHEDFALHNLRVSFDNIYLIDHSSLRFGNKHESWARFMNFMLLYNRRLEMALTKYMKDNRSAEENLSLQLMRIYKTGQLIQYHIHASTHSSGKLKVLSQERVVFWSYVLDRLLGDAEISDEKIVEYKQKRDRLRSSEEKQRQKELQQLF